MNHLPRIALGSVHTDDNIQPVLWALMNILERSGLQVQSFSSQSRCDSRDRALAITGQRRRCLDSWLMQPDVCGELFHRGSRCADLSVVDGQFDVSIAGASLGGSLDTLCEWLDLPRIAVVNAQRVRPCQVPAMPAGVDGIVIDNVAGVEQLCRLQTILEACYGVPVLGAMLCEGHLRAAAELSAGEALSAELCDALGRKLSSHFRLERFVEIAARRDLAAIEGGLFRDSSLLGSLNVAIAHDDAFSCYFPDTLDLLESLGAVVNYFSPLRSESLPAGTDVVYLGCGELGQYVDELAANVCMKESLWRHVSRGGRVFGENAGLAYLCREIVVPGGASWPMVGLLPALARRHPHPVPDCAVEVHTARGSWLIPSNEPARGYLSSEWGIHPDGCLTPLISEAEHRHDLVGDYQIVGSRLHLNFAACPEYVERFFRPCRNACLKPVF